MNKLILVRGIPGCGKSALAFQLTNAIEASGSDAIRIEVDGFFMENCHYKFDPDKLRYAHEWCQNKTLDYIGRGWTVVVSNTFTTIKELCPYFEIAKKFGQCPAVYLCQNEFQNIHDVPSDVITRMKSRFQYDISELYK